MPREETSKGTNGPFLKKRDDRTRRGNNTAPRKDFFKIRGQREIAVAGRRAETPVLRTMLRP